MSRHNSKDIGSWDIGSTLNLHVLLNMSYRNSLVNGRLALFALQYGSRLHIPIESTNLIFLNVGPI